MYYLKADSEEALYAALENAGVTQRHYDMKNSNHDIEGKIIKNIFLKSRS